MLRLYGPLLLVTTLGACALAGGTTQLEIRVYRCSASAGGCAMRVQNTPSLSGLLY